MSKNDKKKKRKKQLRAKWTVQNYIPAFKSHDDEPDAQFPLTIAIEKSSLLYFIIFFCINVNTYTGAAGELSFDQQKL